MAFWVGWLGAMQCRSILRSSAKVRIAFEVNWPPPQENDPPDRFLIFVDR